MLKRAQKPAERPPVTTQSVYKYRINELLIRQHGIKASEARRDLQVFAGVSRATLSADANILLSSRDEVPRARLIAYATFFKLTPEELTNG